MDRHGGEAVAVGRRRGHRARRPGDADRPRRRRRQFGGLRRQREDLDFASVQRDNPEMERRCQEVIDRCVVLGADNPILSVPRRRRRRPVQRDPGTAARLRRGRRDRPRQGAQRRPLAVADAAVVQRIAGTLRARRAARAPGRIRGDLRDGGCRSSRRRRCACSRPSKRSGMALCPALSLSIPVGKDSLSMQASFHDGEREPCAWSSPVSLIVSRVRTRRGCPRRVDARCCAPISVPALSGCSISGCRPDATRRSDPRAVLQPAWRQCARSRRRGIDASLLQRARRPASRAACLA
jgi:hypothetical protein